jgi:hypothetical protein
VSSLAVAADAVLTAPAPAVTMLFSLDGSSWQRLQTNQVNGGTTVSAAFHQPGYFLAASVTEVVGTAGTGSGKHSSVVILSVLIGLAAILLVLAPFLYFRSRGD